MGYFLADTEELTPTDPTSQIANLRSNGVKFELTSEDEALTFLNRDNYFSKVQPYTRCFSRYTNPTEKRVGMFINLDFAYLVELTKLDHHLREIVLAMSLNIEHHIKVELNRMISAAAIEPSKLMLDFFSSERTRKLNLLSSQLRIADVQSAVPTIAELLASLSSRDCQQVIDSLTSMRRITFELLSGIDVDYEVRSLSQAASSPYAPSLKDWNDFGRRLSPWEYMELSSFGGIIAFYKYCAYTCRMSETDPEMRPLLFPTKILRNAAAHNSSLLTTLNSRLSKPVGGISKQAKSKLGIDEDLVNLTRRAPIVHDFTALLLCYLELVKAEGAREDARAWLNELSRRFSINHDYFSKQENLKNGLEALTSGMNSAANLL